MSQTGTSVESIDLTETAKAAEEIAYLTRRHRVSPAIVREIIRRLGSVERSALDREIRKGKARR
jgi:hypothetical protein